MDIRKASRSINQVDEDMRNTAEAQGILSQFDDVMEMARRYVSIQATIQDLELWKIDEINIWNIKDDYDEIKEIEANDTYSKTVNKTLGTSLMTVQQFKNDVTDGMLIDYDGHGHPVKDMMMKPNTYVYPSRIRKIPKDATHIMWYNR